MTVDVKLFAERVRSLREAMGWSRKKLADLAGVSYHQVVKWELATRGTTADRVAKLYEVFGVTPKQFWDTGYIPGEFPLDKKASTTPVIDAGVPEVDEEGRALKCPRCQRAGYTKSATYCSTCGFPLLNLCSGRDSHVNPPPARYCETCGAKTFWGMTDDELDANGIPRFGG